jgi:phage shock protein E
MTATPDPSAFLLIDVRSAAEFAAGHVRGAINLPLDRFAQEIERVAPDKHASIMLCCASGARSGMACSFLQQQGYSQVVNGGGAGSVALQLNRPIDRL